MNEIKVGERVTIILEAVEHDTCEGCFFKGVAARSAEFVEKYSVGIADSANDLKE